ncbi:hypothetical protein HMPREF1023_02874 [Eggerthella sp. 1_3_56FAA]|nr:hypothetical protein HMPREF1023_02874 [Eggerthella sp. 1_3_56FAA]
MRGSAGQVHRLRRRRAVPRRRLDGRAVGSAQVRARRFRVRLEARGRSPRSRAERGTGRRKMRRGIAADAPLSDAGEERLSEEDRRALKMIEELFPGEYRAAKREVAAAIASDAPSSLGGLAAILSQRGNPDGAVLAGRIVEALLTDKATLMDAASMLYFSDGKVVDVW